MKLAEALVLRKHLDTKTKQLEPIYINGQKGLFEVKTERRAVSADQNVDELVTQVPKITLENVTAEYDKYSKALRQIDTAVQATNWQTELVSDVDMTGINV